MPKVAKRKNSKQGKASHYGQSQTIREPIHSFVAGILRERIVSGTYNASGGFLTKLS